MHKSGKKQSEETGVIQTWTQILLSQGLHITNWAIKDLTVKYKM